MISRAVKSTDPPPIWFTADVADYLQVSDRQAQRWCRDLLAYGLEPISAKPFRCLQDNFVQALRAYGRMNIQQPTANDQVNGQA